MIRSLDPGDGTACDAIVASLPDWFGLEEGIRECADAVRTQPGLVAEVDGEVSGFLTIARPYPQTPEISWLAVHARDRRRGIGRALIAALSDQLRTNGDRLVLVKTLSDRTDPGPEYAETRAFYLAMGFVPVAELILTREIQSYDPDAHPHPAAGDDSLTAQRRSRARASGNVH